MKRIKLHLIFFLPVSLFFASLNAQTEAAMRSAGEAIQKAYKDKGYSLSEYQINTAEEFKYGLSTILYPGNQYFICLADDGERNARLQIKGSIINLLPIHY